MFFDAYYISKNTIVDLPAIAHIMITRDYDYSFVGAMVQWLARQCGKDMWIVDLGFKSSQSQTFLYCFSKISKYVNTAHTYAYFGFYSIYITKKICKTTGPILMSFCIRTTFTP